LAPIAVSWLGALSVPSVRRAYGNGLLCVMTRGILWKLPAGFALAYGLFQIGGEVLMRARLQLQLLQPVWPADPEKPALAALALRGLLPSAEGLASALNCLVATFPISALCALFFLGNGGGALGEMLRALRKRFGVWGWGLFLMLVLCAVAAAIKPALFYALPELAVRFGSRYFLLWCSGLNALAFIFEYLLGTCLQLYLLLIAYEWVRGMRFPREKLLRFAVRRLGFVVKWALVIMAFCLLFLQLPPLIATAISGGPAAPFLELILRSIVAGGMLALATVPIRLALHNDSLAGAIAAHARFLKRNGPETALFLASGMGALFLAKGAEQVGARWAEGSLAGLIWTLGWQVAGAALGGWILAAWVCFYRTGEQRIRERMAQ